jgi:hypothetical protein
MAIAELREVRTNGRMRMRVGYDGPRTRGIELVERLLNEGERADGDLSVQDAADAIRALEGLDLPWLVEGMVEGGELFAAQVHAEMGRGLQEVVQNAQDQGAHNIRFGWRVRDGRGELLIAHDGEPVELHDVVFMAYAMHSGSRRDPEKIGRFGIGLKTLNQLGDRLSVHCPPFNFEIVSGRIRQTPQPRALRSFWSPQARETLFTLRLVEGLDLSFFREWFREWDAESLLFLRNLRRLSLIDLRNRRQIVDYQLREERSGGVHLDLPGGEAAERVVLRDVKSGRQWTRYSVRYPTIKRLRDIKDTDKPFGESVHLGLAIPHRGDRAGRLYAGLPLDEPCELKVSLHAPFFVNVDRSALREDRHGANEWLLDRLGDLIAAVALQRFDHRPNTGWRCVPLSSENVGEPRSWLETHAGVSLERARKRIKARLRFRIGDKDVRVDDVVFEEEALDGLLSDEDQQAYYPDQPALPTRFRDGNRWREVLRDLGAWGEISVPEALQMLDWEEPDVAMRGPRWLVRLAAAALASGYGDHLEHKPWLLLRDGRRLSPADVAARGVLLVHRVERNSLGSQLGVATPIPSAYLAATPEARAVRQWLRQQAVLKTQAADTDAVRALAQGDGDHPVDLTKRDKLLLRIRDLLDRLPADERDELTLGIGKNILLAGHRYNAKGRPLTVAVPPSAAYLPSAIDKSEGWIAAAARTPEISWVDRRYAETLKSKGGTRGQGALAFLRRLGGQVAPRLEPDESYYFERKALPEQQRDELRGVGRVEAILDDSISPDLDRVLDSIVREKRATTRRKRARALFLALNRAWPDLYADHTEAVPAWYQRRWWRYEPITATWLARLASTPWLTTQEKGLHPASPRDVRILTSADDLAGEDPSLYAEELDDDHANTPLAEALGIRGRLPASDLIALLTDFREQELAGVATDPRQVQRCYESLSRYCPGGFDAERVDVTQREIQVAFGFSTGATGLVRFEGRWLPPAKTRRGEYLVPELPTVRGAPELWSLLGVREPDVDDCVGALAALATRNEEDRPAQIRIYRRLLTLGPEVRGIEKKLHDVPFFTNAGWLTGRTVYAVANSALAEALATRLPVWQPPLALEEFVPLLGSLPVQLLDESLAEPDVPPADLVAGAAVSGTMPNAAEHLKNTLFVRNSSLFERISRETWGMLSAAQVALGTGWKLKIRAPGQRRAISTTPPAYFFAQAGLFCALDEEEAGDMATGGESIASLFAEANLTEADRGFIAMAWERAFAHRDDEQEALDEGSGEDDTEHGDGALPLPKRRGRLPQRRRRHSAGRDAGSGEPPPPPDERELLNPASVDLRTLSVTLVETKTKGRLLPQKARTLKQPEPGKKGRGRDPDATRRTGRPQNAKEREGVGFALTSDYLEAAYGLKLENYCDQQNIGADGADLEQDVWVELKAHAGEAPDSIKLTASEAERAREKRDRYWLVVASGLETGHTPALVIVQDPLRRLNAYLGSGIRLVVKT